MKFKVILSCEHASNRCPSKWGVAVHARTLQSHRAYDPGAIELARLLKQTNGWSLHEGRVSRLLIDLNRSLHHPKVFSPWSLKLEASRRQLLQQTYYAPYRQAIADEIERHAARNHRVVHLSIHSFTPVFHGEKRRTEIGLLFDPERAREKELAAELRRRLKPSGFVTHFNQPYRGTDDGLVQTLRSRYSPRLYSGLEIEINQRLWREKGLAGLRPICQALSALAR